MPPADRTAAGILEKSGVFVYLPFRINRIHMKKILSILSLLIIGSLTLGATDDLREAIRKDVLCATGNHHPYIVHETHDTPAPEGFTPFYISHYGRHGSRYQTGGKYKSMAKTVSTLDTLASLGLLTERGLAIHESLRKMTAEHEDMEGILTQKGSMEHRGIAARMYDRFPEVFTQADRDSVLCVSSTVHRCLQSTANFALSLENKAPSLNFEIRTGKRYMKYIANGASPSGNGKKLSHVRDSLVKIWYNPSVSGKHYFTNVSKAKKAVHTSLSKLIYNAIGISDIEGCLDGERIKALELFDFEDLYHYGILINMSNCIGFHQASDFGECRSRTAGVPLLKDFIAKADAALEGNRKCADLRFGHDTGVGPILSLIAVEEYADVSPILETHKHWQAWKSLHMGTNLQMIFYSNAKGEILVKLLHNERETTIPAVSPVNGPYYKWSDLRAYFVSLTEEK